jgi:hypothetical protein
LSEKKEISMPQQLFEAAKISSDQLTGKTWRIKVIEGNRKGSSAYYPADVVEAGAPLFAKGTRIYGDHPTLDEKWSRPERSYRDIVGYFSDDAVFENGDLYANATFIESERERIKELAEAGVIGMSIRAAGDVEETADGPVLKAFTSVSSVDVVTTAGAGGGFDKLLESAREISAAESAADALEEKEPIVMDKELEAALSALIEGVNKLVERADNEDKAKADLAEAERVAAEEAGKEKAPTAAEIAGALVEAELPKAAHAKVIAAVESGTELAEAIKAEKEYLKTVVEESGKTFQGNGSEELQESGISTLGTSMFG